MQQNFHRESVNYFWITIGSLLFCAGLNLFIVPVGLYNGGTVGISQIIRTLLQSRLALPAGFDIAGILNLILNIPLLALAFLQFGRPLFLKTVYSVLTPDRLLPRSLRSPQCPSSRTGSLPASSAACWLAPEWD